MTDSKLIVISGFSASGKDAIIDALLSREELAKFNLQRLVTHADRKTREGEVNGRDHYFVTPAELTALHKNKKLVEVPVTYGTSRKATSKKEFEKILSGDKNLIWRIDLSLFTKVASGEFFKEQFGKDTAEKLIKITKTIFVKTDKDSLGARRRKRDGKKYNNKEYKIRDKQDNLFIEKNYDSFDLVVENKDGELEESVNKIMKYVFED